MRLGVAATTAAIAAIALAGGARAAGSRASPAAAGGALSAVAPDAHALGVAESLLHYCAHVDPKAAVLWRGRIDAMLRGATEAQVVALRAMPEYRSGYDSVSKFTAEVDRHNAERMCHELPPLSAREAR